MAEIDITAQPTPNPRAMKFIVSQTLRSDGKASFSDPDECRSVPLASRLLELANVTKVHFFDNTVTVTQNGASDWVFLEDAIEAVLRAEIARHDPAFVISNGEKPALPLSPEMQRIDKIIDETIRPALQADGGDIDILAYEDKILTITYQGACGDCPSSLYGTLQAIQRILVEQFDPEIQVAVVP